MKDYAINLAEAVTAIDSCDFDTAMDYVMSNKRTDVEDYIKENW